MTNNENLESNSGEIDNSKKVFFILKKYVEWTLGIFGLILILLSLIGNGNLFGILFIVTGTLLIFPPAKTLFRGKIDKFNKLRFSLPSFLILAFSGIVIIALNQENKSSIENNNTTEVSSYTKVQLDEKFKNINSLISKKNYSEAKIILEEILSKDPENPEASKILNTVLTFEKNENEIRKRNEDIQKLSSVIKTTESLIKEKKWNECLSSLDEIRIIFPKDSKVLNLYNQCSKEVDAQVKKEKEDFDRSWKTILFLACFFAISYIKVGLDKKCPNCNKWFKRKLIEKEYLHSTWAHQNKDGSKDKRYTDNKETRVFKLHYKCKACNYEWNKKKHE